MRAKEILSLVLLFALLMFTIIGITSGWSIIFEKNVCATRPAIDPIHEYQWQLWGGCLIQTPSGYWVNHSDYQYLEGDVNIP